MPKPSSMTIVQIVRVAGSRSMRAEIAPALKAAAPLKFMFPRLARAYASRFHAPNKARAYGCVSNTIAASLMRATAGRRAKGLSGINRFDV
jgi:hypothetical protein